MDMSSSRVLALWCWDLGIEGSAGELGKVW